MTYPQHWLFQFGGSLGNPTKDIWSNSIRFSGQPGIILGEAQFSDTQVMSALKQKLTPRFNIAPSAGGLGYSSEVRLRWVKFNEIDSEGRYADEQTANVLDVVPEVAGYGAPIAMLPQLAMAVSWVTPVTRGLAARGRIFVPMPGTSSLTTAYKLSATFTAQVAASWAALISEWADLPGIDLSLLKPSVVSGVGSGARQPITGVRVGDVADTMRSRRNALPEVYSFADVPGTQI